MGSKRRSAMKGTTRRKTVSRLAVPQVIWRVPLCILLVLEFGSGHAQTVDAEMSRDSSMTYAVIGVVPGSHRKAQPILLASARPVNNDLGHVNAAAGRSDPNPTYLRDVLPIIMRRCSRCHNEQARFVYNWLDYRTAFTDRWEIERRVWDSWNGTYFKESMPISNSPESLSITPEERRQIRDWVITGAHRGVPPPPSGPKTKVEKIDAGQRLFSSICAACHQPTGRGIPNVFPPLASSDFLNADKSRAIKIVLNGRQGEIVVNGQKFNNSMPKFPLTDQDIADVLTFVYSAFGNSGVEVTPEQVALLRAEPPDIEGPSAPRPKSEFE
jgi:mono/diheme cytochrome c family protein